MLVIVGLVTLFIVVKPSSQPADDPDTDDEPDTDPDDDEPFPVGNVPSGDYGIVFNAGPLNGQPRQAYLFDDGSEVRFADTSGVSPEELNKEHLWQYDRDDGTLLYKDTMMQAGPPQFLVAVKTKSSDTMPFQHWVLELASQMPDHHRWDLHSKKWSNGVQQYAVQLQDNNIPEAQNLYLTSKFVPPPVVDVSDGGAYQASGMEAEPFDGTNQFLLLAPPKPML